MRCCLCDGEIEVQRSETGAVVWSKGHNADPLADGRCCSTCNSERVLPERITMWLNPQAGRTAPSKEGTSSNN